MITLMIKRHTFACIIVNFIVCLLYLVGCTSTKDNDKTRYQNRLLSSDEIMTIAIIDFQNLTNFGDNEFGNRAASILCNSLSVGKGFTIVEREKLKLILEEQALGQTGIIDDSQIISVGKLLAARYICTGAIESIKISPNRADGIKQKVLSIFGIDSTTHWARSSGLVDDFKLSSWDLTVIVTARIIDVEKGAIVFNRTADGKASKVKLRSTTTAPIYDPSKAYEILKPVMDKIADKIAGSLAG